MADMGLVFDEKAVRACLHRILYQIYTKFDLVFWFSDKFFSSVDKLQCILSPRTPSIVVETVTFAKRAGTLSQWALLKILLKNHIHILIRR